MNTDWRKSSYSQPSGDCLECRTSTEHALVRDTQHRDAGHLAFPLAEWRAFVMAAHTL
ncbi:DUF397 domain-containing protein [Streptomonospora sp. PA3]|uniref:DUF397 domain-containing protein n=1 Tax=Streptomonospora sp. PA3 TaxID=2607326 RepID=UPI00130BCC54|nr:DUF397 domain-containing protein [Streptomonospora sp. PA3]